MNRYVLLLWLAIGAILFVLVTTGRASESSGYTYKDGYYWRDGVPYEKWTYYYPCNYSTSCYYNGRYYRIEHTYERAYPPPKAATTPSVELPKPNDPRWMDKTMDILEFQQRARQARSLRLLEHNAYMEVMSYLGAQGALKGVDPEFAPPGQYAPPGSVFLGPHGHMGNSIYGYTKVNDSLVFGAGDPLINFNVGMQQAASMVKNAGQIHGQGQTDFMDSLKQFAAFEAEKQEGLINLAKIKIAMEALKQQRSKAYVQSREFGFKTEPSGPQLPSVLPPQAGVPRMSTADFMAKIARPYCGSCHSGPKLQGGFDIEDYPGLDMQTKARIWNERLLTSNPSEIMPRDQGKKTGTRLPDEALRQFFLH